MNKLCLMFPGQGSQYIGMGKSLYDSYDIAKECFDEASEVLGLQLDKLCFSGDIEELTATENAQPAILTVSYVAYQVLMKEIKCNPSVVAGHSLGEITALTCTGAISFADAIKIAQQRGKLMGEVIGRGEGSMMAVLDMNEFELEEMCRRISSDDIPVSIANYNSPVQMVVSGHRKAVDKLKAELDSMNVRTAVLNVSAPFHTDIMYPAAIKLRKVLGEYSYHEFKWPVISNVTATPYEHREYIVSKLTNQVYQPVQWMKSIQYAINQDIDTFVEIGPKNVLRNLISQIDRQKKAYSFSEIKDLDVLKEAGIEAKPDGIGLITACLTTAVSTQNFNGDNEEYERGVVMPYRRIQEMKDRLQSEGREPAMEQLKEAVILVNNILKTKKVPDIERKRRINKILFQTNTADLLTLSDF